MYQIVGKKTLSESVKQLTIHAPLVAKKAQPGQFIILQIDETGERIPLTIADFNRDQGTVTIIFMEVGKTTKQLGSLDAFDTIRTFCGPLGTPSEIENFGTVVCVGGGVGIAPLYPILRALKEKGNKVISILGARSKHLLLLEEHIKTFSDEFYVTTDDGSKGRKGFVSDVLKELLEDKQKVDRVIAIGPIIMMKVVSKITKEFNIKTIVSLNPIMVDGTGMCGGCRITVGDETKCACVDGPEFDGHKVDFDNLMIRNRRFQEQEEEAQKRWMGAL